MTNIYIIENKLSDIRKYLGILERYKKYSKEEIVNDIDIKGAVERYLYLAAQATIDLAEAVIAYKKLRKPTTLTDSFHILNERAIIDATMTEKLVKMAGFRNVIAHDYGKINYDIVYKAIHEGVKDIEEFVEKISEVK